MSVASARSNTLRPPAVKLAKGEQDFTTSVSKKSNDIHALQEEVDKNIKLMFAVALAASRNQPINGEKSDLSTQMMNLSSTLSSIAMDKMSTNATLKLAEAQQESSFASMSQMVGQRVSIEDGSREFYGKAGEQVKFQYNILGKDIPANALIQTQISLLNKDGKKILSKTENGKHIGKNSFIWDGKDSKGNNVPVGSYNISVTSSYTIPGNDKKPISLSVTTVQESVVDGVNRDPDGKISFIVNGQKVDSASIQGLMRDGKDEVKEEAKGPISDYISYIGQKVQIKQEKVNFNNNKTNVPFFTKNDALQATVKVRFYDSTDSFVAYSQKVQDIKAGQNNFVWNGEDAKSEAALKDMHANKMLSYVPVGVYRYEVSITTKNEDDTETTYKLDNNGEFVIDSIDKNNGKVRLASGDYKFDIRDVTKLTDKIPEKVQASYISLLQEGSGLIGKRVSFKSDILTYDGNTDPEIEFSLPKPEDGFTLESATIDIMDDKDNVIASIVKPQAEIYSYEAEPVPWPAVGIAALADIANMFTLISKTKINEAYEALFPDGDPAHITGKEKQVMKNYVTEHFRAGNLFALGYEALDQAAQETQKLKNMGVIQAKWNGKGPAPDNKQFPKGNYRCAISYNIKETATNNIRSEEVPLISTVEVIGTHVNKNNEVILDLINGHILFLNQILSVKG